MFMVEDKARWTVMVFMGAERIPGDADLIAAAHEDIAEMQQLFDEGSSGLLNLFVQLHGDGAPKRWKIGESGPVPVSDADADVSDGNALRAFMKWALDEPEPRDQDHVMLVLWGHAYDFAIGRTQTRSGIDALDFGELAEVLRKLKRKGKLDIVGFDACDVATIEMAYQLRDSAKYLLASEIGIPLPGWPYSRIFDRVMRPKDRQMGPAELGSYVVRRFCETYNAEKMTVSLTLLDLQQADKVKTLTECLARKLAVALDRDPAESDLVADLFTRSQTIEAKPFVDAADLCLNLVRYSSDPDVRDAAEELGDCLLTPRPVNPGESEKGVGRPFVADHGSNACRTARLRGVSLYAPHVDPTHDFDAAEPFYEELAFTSETLWLDVMIALADASS
jgi:Clostripain family